MNAVYIDQKKNFNAQFGEVMRSSAIFYYFYGGDRSATISFMNYWRVKRGLEVAILASLRDMSGILVRRERLNFELGEVINYSPRLEGIEFFEGSVEIEIFALKNMVIPYPAIMSIYETQNGVTMVHSYARSYSRHEIEEGNFITNGEEGCWTLRDSAETKSFAIFHNGAQAVPPQPVRLRITSHDSRTVEVVIQLSELKPFQTVKIYPSDHVAGLVEFLGGEVGFANLSFFLGEAFTRMLVGNERCDCSDMQVTHSNFNYSQHQTDKLAAGDVAYMYVPSCGVSGKNVIVYPDSDVGEYELNGPMGAISFFSGQPVVMAAEKGMLTFFKHGDAMPSRLVTAISGASNAAVLPFECSLGVLTRHQPPKRLWWGVCEAGARFESRLIVHDLEEIYGSRPHDCFISVSVYSSCSREVLTTAISGEEAKNLDCGVSFATLFPNLADFLGGAVGYYSVYSDYVGLTCYSTMEKRSGSMTLEHGF